MDNTCPRCGLSKSYHENKTLECVRKKPYKLRDGKEVHLGIRVWYYNRFDKKINSGIVRFIGRNGVLSIEKDKKDRDPNNLYSDWRYDPLPSAYDSCFSSLENAEKFRDKN